VAKVANECLKANLPLVVEALACASERIAQPNSGKTMGAACRIAFEHGADLVKTYYSGDQADFRDNIIQQCPIPVLIAGGPKMETTQAVFRVVFESIQAGAAGIVFGRNIWQSGRTRQMIMALQHLIHHNGSVGEAMEQYGG
jgi:DhnA family fructose-bisphosphate aldolase class Ia